VGIALIFVVISLLTAILFASNTLIMSKGMKSNTPVSLGLVFRSLPAIPVLLITSVFVFGFSSISVYFDFKILALLFLSSLILTMGDFLIMYGLKAYSIRAVIPALAFNPIITLLWLVGTGLEKITYIIIIGTVITILGVVVVTFQAETDEDKTNGALYGALIGITVALLFGTMPDK